MQKILHSVAEVEEMLHGFGSVDDIAFDTETTRARPLSRELVGMSFASDGDGYYIPLGHKKQRQLDFFRGNIPNIASIALEKVKEFFKTWSGCVFMHNAVFDLHMLDKEGIHLDEWKAMVADTMIAVGLLGAKWEKALEKQVLNRYGYEMSKLKKLEDTHEVNDPSLIPVEGLYKYACDDAIYTLKLGRDVLEELREHKLDKVFWQLEMEVLSATLEMLKTGIKVDTAQLIQMDKEVDKKLVAVQREWTKLFPGCDIGSSQSISRYMFEEKRLWSPIGLERGKSGFYSTDAKKVLSKLKPQGLGKQALKLLLECRGLAKMQSTYTGPLAILTDSDGRLRPSQNQVGTDTGRYSSSNPNCQNIPRPSAKKWPEEFGSLPPVRKVFVAEKGWRLIDVDYSQIELRVITHLSKDPVMLDVYRQKCKCIGGGYWEPGPYEMLVGEKNCPLCKGTGFNGDIHQATADATGASRQESKAINFGLMYGMSPHTLAATLEIPIRKAEVFHRKYFEGYAGIRRWHRVSLRRAEDRHFVKTITGRIRYIDNLFSADKKKRGHARRQVWNTMVQGSAADLIKIALRNLYRYWKQEGLLGTYCRMMLMVHDELLCEVREELVEEQMIVIKRIMESVAQLDVPLLADPNVGDNWMEAH